MTMHQATTAERPTPNEQTTAQRRLAVLLAASLALAATPVSLPEFGGASAWAQGPGNAGGGRGAGNAGGGRGGGGDNSGGSPGNSGGRGGESAGGSGGGGFGNGAAARGGQAGGGVASRGRERADGGGRPADVGRALAGMRDALTRGGGTVRKSEARGRYAAAAGWHDGERPPGGSFGRPSYTLDDALTASLVARGWQAPATADDTGFRNHGHRVSTMVEIAKLLGYGAHVGALQANFGRPYGETTDADAAREALTAELAALQDTLGGLDDPESDTARELEARLAALEDERAALDVAADALTEWDSDWRTADLDVNGDGVVDLADLEAARALAETNPSEAAAEAPESSTDGETERAEAPESTTEADTALVDVQ